MGVAELRYVAEASLHVDVMDDRENQGFETSVIVCCMHLVEGGKEIKTPFSLFSDLSASTLQTLPPHSTYQSNYPLSILSSISNTAPIQTKAIRWKQAE
jgi:hypothetical protein